MKGFNPGKDKIKDTNQLGSQIVREIVIPELTKEVNENKNFAHFRQVYNSLILATWYKKKIKDSILEQVYADKNKVAGVNIDDPQEKQRIYKRYLQAFKKGVYNYIKEDKIPYSFASDPGAQTVARKYFSGGIAWGATYLSPVMTVVENMPNSAMVGNAVEIDIKLDMAIKDGARDLAMKAEVISRSDRSRIAWGEKRKTFFLIAPEQMTIAYKLKGEPVRKLEEDGLKVVVGLPDDEQGLVILSQSETALEWIRKKGFQTQPEGIYEILFRLPKGAQSLSEQMVERRFADVPGVAVEWSRAYDLQGPCYRLVLIASADKVAPVVNWVQSNGYSVIQKTRTSFGASRLFSGLDEQKSRKMTWEELIDFMQALGVNEFKDMSPLYKKTIEEEQIDRKIVEKSLENEDFIKDIFESLFARPDLNLSKVSGHDIWYLGEGGFRRVYQVNLRISGEPHDYSFLFKVLKEDVKHSDSGFIYNERYVRAIESVLGQIRQKDLELYPPFVSHRVVTDSKGRERIVIAEGFVPLEVVPDVKARRLALEAYFKMFLILDSKIFLKDPRINNVIITKNHRVKEIAAIIDLDNIYGPRLRADRRVYPEDYSEEQPSFELDPVRNLLGFGYTDEEILNAACDILGVERAEVLFKDYLGRRGFFQAAILRNFKIVGSKSDPLPKREAVKHPLSFKAGPVDITINGLPRKVPGTASLETILFDMNLSPEDGFIIELNGHRIADERTGWVHDDFKVPVADLLTAAPENPGANEIQIKFSSDHLNVEKLGSFHKLLEDHGFYECLKTLIKDLYNLQNVLGHATEQDQKLKAALNFLSTLISNQVMLRDDTGSEEHAGSHLLSVQQFHKLEISAKRIDFRNKGDRRMAMLEYLDRVKEAYQELLDIYHQVSGGMVNEAMLSDHKVHLPAGLIKATVEGRKLYGTNGPGGIDLTPAHMNVQTQNNGGTIKFHLDPAMLKQLQNAPGFVPVIIGMHRMNGLREFLEAQ